jgi:hypothetical protein
LFFIDHVLRRKPVCPRVAETLSRVERSCWTVSVIINNEGSLVVIVFTAWRDVGVRNFIVGSRSNTVGNVSSFPERCLDDVVRNAAVKVVRISAILLWSRNDVVGVWIFLIGRWRWEVGGIRLFVVVVLQLSALRLGLPCWNRLYYYVYFNWRD